MIFISLSQKDDSWHERIFKHEARTDHGSSKWETQPVAVQEDPRLSGKDKLWDGENSPARPRQDAKSGAD